MANTTKQQSAGQSGGLGSKDIYQSIMAEPATSQIIQVKQGAPLPLKPEANLIEMDARQYAWEDFSAEVRAIELEKGEPRRIVKETQIDPDAAPELTRKMLSDGVHVSQSGMELCIKTQKHLKECQYAFDAFKQAHDITRPVQTGNKFYAMLLTFLFLLIDSLFNGVQVFSSNMLNGGLVGAVAVSGLVSVVNNSSGYLCGEYLWRNMLSINNSHWRGFAWGATGLITFFALLVNTLFAYFRAFGESGPGALLTADSHVYLNFFGILFVGMMIFFWVGIKWNKTNDPLIRYGDLYREISAQQTQLANDREAALDDITDWKEYAADELDALLDREREDFALADEALDECKHLDKEITALAEAKSSLYGAVIARYRSVIVGCGFNKTPAYFMDEPHVDLHSPIDLDALQQHVDLLRDNLEQLGRKVQECKQVIFAEAEKASEALYKQCCEGTNNEIA